MAEFTKGPWKWGAAYGDNGGEFLVLRGDDRERVLDAEFGGSLGLSADDAALIAAAPTMHAALLQWKCGSCGGSGVYQQNASGRARSEAQGREINPRYEPEPVTCKVCNGDGLNPIASVALAEAEDF